MWVDFYFLNIHSHQGMVKSYIYINYCLGLYVFDEKNFMSFIGFQCVFASRLIAFIFKLMLILSDFSGRASQSTNEDFDLKWKELDPMCTKKSVFPSTTTQAGNLMTLLL